MLSTSILAALQVFAIKICSKSNSWKHPFGTKDGNFDLQMGNSGLKGYSEEELCLPVL